jgi:hypothetical protein
VFVSREHPVDVGTRTEAVLLAEFVKLDVPVLTPFGVNHRYDFVVDVTGELLRVQCKTARFEDGSVVVPARSVRSSGGTRHKRPYTAEEIDLLAAWCPAIERAYVLPSCDLDRTAIRLRVAPPGNRHQRGVRCAQHYAIARLAHQVERLICTQQAAGSSPAAGFEVDPTLPAELTTPRTGERARPWTYDRCVAAVARFLEDSGGGPTTQVAYAAWARGHPDRPSASTLTTHGGLRRLREAARGGG